MAIEITLYIRAAVGADDRSEEMDAIEEAIAGLADMPQESPPLPTNDWASMGYRNWWIAVP
ncbi:MAG: hypothetical protein M0Z36_12360 [Thermaerobacter sp.]|nr:hypothetical protein [Thermaerobacter sp.]